MSRGSGEVEQALERNLVSLRCWVKSLDGLGGELGVYREPWEGC